MFRKLTSITNKALIRTQLRQFAPRTASTLDGSLTPDHNNPLIEKILKKSAGGRDLAEKVTRSTNLDQFEREQRYEIFINKMNQLYHARRSFQRKLNTSTKRMRRAHLLFQKPIKQCLTDYSKMTTHGFNDELIATFLENFNGVIQAGGNNPMVYDDYSITEMDQSWRMEKVAEDLKWGLTHEFAFFSPANQGRAAKALGEIGYKNTEVIDLWLKNLHQKLADDGTIKFTSVPEFEKVVYGGMKGFNPKHYVFQGFQNDSEFSDHLQTLMMFKENQDKNSMELAENDDVSEMEKAMQTVIEAAKELKGIQVDQQAAIEALRQQFFKLQQAHNKHEFLQQNKYIVFDMLELQELLVKGGYLGPEEALLGATDSMTERMERASNVFYDLVLNHSPELLSPQYEEFYDAATENEKPIRNYAKEDHNTMRLKFISDILVGLAEQAQSARRCALDKDYPHEFYEKLLMPEEAVGRSKNAGDTLQKRALRKTPYVMMDNSYLNGWRNFSAESGKMIETHFERLIEEENEVNGLLKGLRSLSACKYEARQMRDRIVEKALEDQQSERPQGISTQAGIDGLQGMGNCGYAPEGQDTLVDMVIAQLMHRSYTFSQKFELLNGMALVSSKYPKVVDSPLFKRVMAEVDAITYDAIDNDLNYKQYNLLQEVHETLRQLGKPTFANESLRAAVANKQAVINRFGESRAEHYDPLKSKVVAGLAQGLNNQEITQMKNSQAFSEYAEDLSIEPDIVTGYKGDQLAIYVLTHRQSMHDTKTADGRTNHFMSLTPNTRPVAVAIDSIIDYDLQQFKLEMRDDFNLGNLLGDPKGQVVLNHAYRKFANFAGTLTRNLDNYEASGNFDQFIDQMSEFFRFKAKLDLMHDPIQLTAGNDELKLALIKLSLYHDTKLTPQEQAKVHTASGSSFNQIIEDLKASVIQQGDIWSAKQSQDPINSQLDLKWQGTRQAVELPHRVSKRTKKDIEPELISSKFLKHGDYHHYDDWKQLMKETFDQFNLMELKDTGVQMNYDAVDHYRRVPKGIFPTPNVKRHVMELPGTQKGHASNADRFVQFEKDPHAFMLEKEFEISKKLKPLTPEVSLITNLQNIKFAMLANFSDKDLCKEMLLKVNYTDKLIEEHLKKNKKPLPTTVTRDPASFRKYMESVPNQPDAFSQFYLNEGMKQARAKEIFEKVQEKHSKFEEEGVEDLADELDRILMKNERENEDLFNLTSPLANYVNVTVDVKSLGVLEKTEQTSSGLSDSQFLTRERCLAESRVIKSKIIYKVNHGIQLSNPEKRYMKEWQHAMKQNQTIIEDCLVPSTPSSLKIKDLSPEDIEQFNTLTRVQLDKKIHGDYAFNDVVLEVSQAFDNQAVRAVELSCLQETMKNDWNFGKDFKLVTKRNKEIDRVLARYEEQAFRCAGQFTDSDIGHIKSMFTVGRNFDSFDKAYLKTDLQSLDHFIEDVNPYDSRIQMLETWLYRKEQEMNKRVNLPTPELKRSDRTIYSRLEKEYKPARERLVALIVDGKEKESLYKKMSQDKLHQVVESLTTRMNLFEGVYPDFLPLAVKGIMEHPNLSRADHANLDAFCKLFNLDWRGDMTLANRDEFMATNPIYLDPRDQSANHNVATNQSVSEALRKACQPYLSGLAEKITKY